MQTVAWGQGLSECIQYGIIPKIHCCLPTVIEAVKQAATQLLQKDLDGLH